MMLIADIVDDELPSGRITIVATHLEDMTTPAHRKKQLIELLDEIKTINHPVIVAGDMNTSTHDAAPVSVTRALKERFGSGKWWAEEGVSEVVRQATPFGWAYDVSRGLIGFARNMDDPTVRSIPLVGKNPEASFFATLENFRFADGSAFDFRGTRARSSNGRAGNLADSNERGEKGFVPTSELGRNVWSNWQIQARLDFRSCWQPFRSPRRKATISLRTTLWPHAQGTEPKYS
jgi:hypothetical protein